MGKRIWFLLLVLLLVFSGYCVIYMATVVEPIITSVAEIKVKSMMNRNINDAIRQRFKEEEESLELFDIRMDEKGKVTLLQTDTVAMNRLVSELTERIQKSFVDLKEERVEVPVGTIFGNSLLSQLGPSVQLKVVPLRTVSIRYTTEFESMGVNQTRHKIYLQIDSTARVLVPFSSEEIKLKNKILIAETVVLGDVPQSFVYVPEEDVLDVV